MKNSLKKVSFEEIEKQQKRLIVLNAVALCIAVLAMVVGITQG